MEDELIRLLEKIEKAGLRTGIGKIQLKNELKQSDASFTLDLSEKLIKEAHKSGLIRDKEGQSKPEDSSDREDMVCVLTIKGFELLNQIWIKKAIVKFNESSDKSSDILISVTFFIGLLTILLIPEQKIFWVVIAYILFIIVLYRKKLQRIFRK